MRSILLGRDSMRRGLLLQNVSVVCLSVFVLGTPMSPAKTVEQIVVPLGMWSRGTKEPCYIDGSPDLPTVRCILGRGAQHHWAVDASSVRSR